MCREVFVVVYVYELIFIMYRRKVVFSSYA